MAVEPASMEFSIISFKAFIGATMISPAAILLTTSGSNGLIEHQLDVDLPIKLRTCLDTSRSASWQASFRGSSLCASRPAVVCVHRIRHCHNTTKYYGGCAEIQLTI